MAGRGRRLAVDERPTEETRRKFDAVPPEKAVVLAWTDAGLLPLVRSVQQDAVRTIMPNLARALDRLSGKQ